MIHQHHLYIRLAAESLCQMYCVCPCLGVDAQYQRVCEATSGGSRGTPHHRSHEPCEIGLLAKHQNPVFTQCADRLGITRLSALVLIG